MYFILYYGDRDGEYVRYVGHDVPGRDGTMCPATSYRSHRSASRKSALMCFPYIYDKSHSTVLANFSKLLS